MVRVNDIFEELSEENKRLLNYMTFANECILKLIDLKTFIELIFNKIKDNLEECDSQKYKQLNDETNEVLLRRPDLKDDKIIDNQSIDNFVNYRKNIKSSAHLTVNNVDFIDYSNDSNLNIGYDLGFESNETQFKRESIPEFRCDFGDCNRVFKTKKSYETHKRLVHLKTKSIVCPYPDCKFGTQNKYPLKTHLSIQMRDHLFAILMTAIAFLRTRSHTKSTNVRFI